MSFQDLLEVVPSGSEDQALLRAIDFARLPRHVAVIMDGNGRWAKLRHKPRVEGHRAGIASVRDVVETSARLGLQVLTLYAFSVENWKRPQSEVTTLMGLLKRYLRSELDTLLRNNIRFRVIGRMEELPADVQDERFRFVCVVDRRAHRSHRVRAKRCTASRSSRLFSAASSLSADASAPATQCCTCSSSTLNASDSSAVLTAAICVRMSMQ